MNIAFLTGGLPPGRDGVGDYTRTLAAECLRQGHGACIVALNDGHLAAREEVAAAPTQPAILRLSSGLPWLERVEAARECIARAGAERVSVQFVGYAYQKKGIPLGLAGRIRAIAGERPIQIMLHELWSGGDPGTPLLRRLVGAAQRHATLSLLRGLRPAVIHTHAPIYRDELARRGLTAKILPLFGQHPGHASEPLRIPRRLARSPRARRLPARRLRPRGWIFR